MKETIDAWQPVRASHAGESDVRLVPGTTDQYQQRYELHTGPTPIIGENGQLELLLRSLKAAKRNKG